MPKMKTHKGLMKRIKITATGKIKHKKPGFSHLKSCKGGKRLRQGRNKSVVSREMTRGLEGMLNLHLRGPDKKSDKKTDKETAKSQD